VINALGASATALVVAIFVLTKFVHGAWIVVVLIPVLVLVFSAIHAYYRELDHQLELKGIAPVRDCPHKTAIIPVTRMHPGIANAIAYAKCLTHDVRAVYVEIDPAQTQALQEAWAELKTDVPLEVLPSPYRSWVGVLLSYISALDAQRSDDIVTVILPEFVPSRWWQEILHNQSYLRLKTALIHRPGIVVTSVRYLLR
jgi:hypothetical protein